MAQANITPETTTVDISFFQSNYLFADMLADKKFFLLQHFAPFHPFLFLVIPQFSRSRKEKHTEKITA